MALWIIVILGIVEGITEFLPISSTGHLIIVGHWLDYNGPRAKTFEIAIQSGAILAVVWKYRKLFRGLLKTGIKEEFSGFRGCFLLCLTTLPAVVLGPVCYPYIKAVFDRPKLVAVALIVGGLALIAIEKVPVKKSIKTLNEIHPSTALLIGLWQCLAMWPGFSRSGATIIGGMLLGMNRRLAAQYSFLAGVPVLLSATVYVLAKDYRNLQSGDIAVLCMGTAISFVAALFAVNLFLHILSKYTLAGFGYYRIALALACLYFV